jgi:hypothetical protein
MKFEALQARYGDCLLLTFDGPSRTNRLLVDGGPSRVFDTSLSRRLEMERQGRLNEPLIIDAVMISHIDEDHILGILDLFAVLQEAEERRTPPPYKVRWLLHNSFDAMAGEGEGGTARTIGGETVLASFGAIGVLPLPGEKEADETAVKVLASYPQGSKLSTMAAALRISRNPPDQQVLMFEGSQPRTLRIGDAKLRILGPLEWEVGKLRAEWAKWRAKKQRNETDAEGAKALAAYLDSSVPNLSSIVALVEFGSSRILLTGDARGDKILTGLEQAGLLTPGGPPLKVDILKLPHHGSSRNVELDFFQRIHADHYVVSGDGTYVNPDPLTFNMIQEARPAGGYTVHLTYPAEQCDAMAADWLKKRSRAFEPANHAVAPIVQRWRVQGLITVKEGPVEINLP